MDLFIKPKRKACAGDGHYSCDHIPHLSALIDLQPAADPKKSNKKQFF